MRIPLNFIVGFRPHLGRFTAADSDGEDIWEYETIRRRSIYAEQRIDNAATLRPAVSATLPSSLRHLFEDETGHNISDTTHSPMTLKPSTANTSGFLNAAMTLPLDPTENLPTMEPPGQGFKRGSPVPVDPIIQMEIQPDPFRGTDTDERADTWIRPSIGSSDLTPPLDVEGEHKAVPIKPSPPIINIDFTPASGDLDQTKQHSSPVTRPPITAYPGASAPSQRPPVTVTRKRSQSNADTSSRSRLALNLDLTPDLDLASPKAFQFPLPRRGSPVPSTAAPPPHLPEYHGQIPPVSGPTGHQMTHSLDASPKAAHRRLSPGGLGPPHVLSRTRSATVLPEGVSTEGLVRTGFPGPRPVEDSWLRVASRPSTGNEKERNVSRNNSDSSLDQANNSTPGLRDVLKVGFDHGPSPSIMHAEDRLLGRSPH